MQKKIVISVMTLMVVALAGTAMAQGGHMNGFYRNNSFIFDQLTPEKQHEAAAIFKKFENKFEPIKSQIWAKRTELNALVNSGAAEKDDITALVGDLTILRDKDYKLRKQLSEEIEQVTGIAMPVRSFAGYGMNNGRMDRRSHRRPPHNGRNCWDSNF
ncbi:periplasmic heavy metal sensor [Maridesulfovibrio zosterae]|uniref:periplasmic heavy metal sensor n=1 Tax=Maridesulfovibrio zosterae TaxID=82171 RepID=UPI000408754B|nr:periplasmic heavy metal sensor [Maridesulfovibrio zosterae]